MPNLSARSHLRDPPDVEGRVIVVCFVATIAYGVSRTVGTVGALYAVEVSKMWKQLRGMMMMGQKGWSNSVGVRNFCAFE